MSTGTPMLQLGSGPIDPIVGNDRFEPILTNAAVSMNVRSLIDTGAGGADIKSRTKHLEDQGTDTCEN